MKEKELQDVQGELSRLKAANEALMEGDVRASQSAEQMSERLARLEAGKAAAEDEARRLKAALDDTVQTAEELEKVKARLVEYVEVIETLTTEDSQKVPRKPLLSPPGCRIDQADKFLRFRWQRSSSFKQKTRK